MNQVEKGKKYYRNASCAMLASDSGHSPEKLLLLSLLKSCQ